LKTKTRSERERTINIVGCSPIVCERIRASLRRSPFHVLTSEEPVAAEDAELYVVPAAAWQGLPGRGVPVIAWGPAELMRGAFLAGCDDFLKEPWTPEELGLRAHAALSRAERRYSFPWGEVSFEGKDLRTPGGLAALTLHESRILGALLRNRGRPVPREALAYSLADAPPSASSRAVDVHIVALRKKVRCVMREAGRFIVCVRGQGYMVP
jgi:Transcriptional regulatory protein, C terminal